MKENPFSIYDFLGYLIPGAFCIYSLIFLLNSQECLESYRSFQSFYDKNKGIFDIESIFIATVFAYFLGHVLSFLSALTIERYSTWRLGYPSEYLFNNNMKQHVKSFFIAEKSEKVTVITIFILRIFCCLIILPITIFDWTIGLALNPIIAKNLDSKLNTFLSRKIQKFIAKNYKDKSFKINTNKNVDWFRIIYHYAVENTESHFAKMQNYVALFGFTRTITFILIVDFWSALFFLYKGILTLKITIYVNLILWILAYLMYINFNKFYRKFVLESIMAFVTVAQE